MHLIRLEAHLAPAEQYLYPILPVYASVEITSRQDKPGKFVRYIVKESVIVRNMCSDIFYRAYVLSLGP
jgi:hypothetical protein